LSDIRLLFRVCRRTFVLVAASGLLAATAQAAASVHPKHKQKHAPKAIESGPLYATREDAMQAAQALAERAGLDAVWVQRMVGQARYVPAIARSAAPGAPGTAKNWALYRSRFIEPVRIGAGVRFWQANRDTLARAERETGVPASIIAGIIGVETMYGRHTGNYRVMDALTTLAFDFPPDHPRAAARSAYFLSELEAYLLLTARTGTDPLALRGSYAGAMGYPQFMPSSWAKYAVDYDGDGRIDLFFSMPDVIGSVANYFRAFQWQPGMPTHYAVQLDAASLDLPALLAPDILPTFSPAALREKGAIVEEAAQAHNGLLALIELQNGDAPPQYVAGTQNFYALTRYNWSSYYAMAVIELGRAVQSALPGPMPK